MIKRFFSLTSACLLFSAPLHAQTMDPALGAEPVRVSEDGHLIIDNGGRAYSCSLAVSDDLLTVADCELIEASGLSSLSTEDWEERITKAMLDSGCKLSTLGTVGDVIEAEALAAGIPADQVADARDEIAVRVDEVIDRMLWEGKLTVRDGEFALDACK